jgi:ABC-type phosphate/phosphonate transport system permease subunit
MQSLFKNLKNIEPSQGIEEKILKSIALEKSWRSKKRLIFADALTLFSLGAFIFVVMNFWNGIAKSEFWSLLRLAGSDTAAVASFWKDFAFSLLETFPAASLAIVLASVLLLILSIDFYFKSTSNYHTKNWV